MFLLDYITDIHILEIEGEPEILYYRVPAEIETFIEPNVDSFVAVKSQVCGNLHDSDIKEKV